MYNALDDKTMVAAVLKLVASDSVVKNLVASSPAVAAASNSLVGY